MVEVPGIGEEELIVDVQEDSLTLKTVEGSRRKYLLELDLPKVLKEEMKKTFEKGILIINIKKQKSS